MDETEIVDRWVNFLKPLLQRDIDVLLKLYLSDFNRKYNTKYITNILKIYIICIFYIWISKCVCFI